MSEPNKAIVRGLFEELNRGNLSLVYDLFATNVVFHNAGADHFGDLDGFKQFQSEIRTGFPDLRFTIDNLIAEDDRVSYRYILLGTHRGEYMGVPATGKQVTMTGMGILRIARGKIAEGWFVPDLLGLLQQLGALPAH